MSGDYNDGTPRLFDKDFWKAESVVAQISQPAVSPISKSAEREMFEAYQNFSAAG
jgi:hypothetical protein